MDSVLLKKFVAIVGMKNALTNVDDQAPYLKEWRDLWKGHTPVVLRPDSTAQVSAILALAHENSTKIVPQSGNTGLVGGQTPMGEEVLLSLDRMDKVLSVDAADSTMT